MRKIYQKYFEIPEENKGIMGEHVFFARLAVSIACIVLCMSAMGFSAYAYFTASVSSNMNQIQAANFDLEVQIESQTETSSASYESEKTYKLQAGSIYEFVLTKRGNATTGYCQIVIMEDENTEKESVYTRQFGKSTVQEGPVDNRVVQIEVKRETRVKFIPCWGTHSVEETNRFDEQSCMIFVNESMEVNEKEPKPQTNGVTNGTVTDSPAVTSEPTTTSTLESTSEPSTTITPSEIQDTPDTESATSTEATSVTEPETST